VSDETIVAIATPVGFGGVGVVRLSGPSATTIAQKLWRSQRTTTKTQTALKPRQLHLGWLHEAGRQIDQALLVSMPAPHSYTGEDVVEIQTHGAPAVLDWAVTRAQQAGARLAQPGEFTKRAYLNGKIDLTQAEAVNDLIHATSIGAVRAASDQLAGGLRVAIDEIRAGLIELSVAETAWLDFGDEDIAPKPATQLCRELRAINKQIDQQIDSARQAAVLREGVRVALIGLPNAGKSTLLNQLLHYDRSIVTAQPGTTRDTIEEIVVIEDIPMRFVDTAGLNTRPDAIEQLGIERSKQVIRLADIIVLLVAPGTLRATKAFLREHQLETLLTAENTIVLASKADLAGWRPIKWPPLTTLQLSAQSGKGLKALQDQLAAFAKHHTGLGNSGESALISAQRHLALLKTASQSIDAAQQALAADTPRDLVVSDIDIAIEALNELAGDNISQAKLDAMFSTFCIGK